VNWTPSTLALTLSAKVMWPTLLVVNQYVFGLIGRCLML
jgi:hypothetical protein